MFLNRLDRYRDIGLLVLRVGFGALFVWHGLPKLLGGPPLWETLAKGVGLTWIPPFWGLLAAISESVGGLLLILGLLLRLGAALIFLTMMGAVAYHLQQTGPAGTFAQGYSRAIEMMIVMLALFLTGPGRYSLDDILARRHIRP